MLEQRANYVSDGLAPSGNRPANQYSDHEIRCKSVAGRTIPLEIGTMRGPSENGHTHTIRTGWVQLIAKVQKRTSSNAAISRCLGVAPGTIKPEAAAFIKRFDEAARQIAKAHGIELRVDGEQLAVKK